ncbi:MAG: thioesterase [Roseivirga sp.]|nr:thioesterase [Roseivirga sp.]
MYSSKSSPIKLFCFPYAGGSAMVYHSWKMGLGTEIELRPIELAGRGRRINEAPYKDLREAVEDVFAMIQKETQQSPYILFGHSMGAMIAYELAQKIRKEKMPGPLHLFFSGKGALHINRPDEKIYHKFNDAKFKEEVLELGGTPPQFFEHPELMDLFLPLLKNDFRIAETHRLKTIEAFDQDITVLLGREDDLNKAECEEWVKHTSQSCHFHYFPGGHFFINDEQENIFKIIRDRVQQYSLSKC